MGRRKKTISVVAPIPDVSSYPDLVVVLVGLRIASLPRIATLQGIRTSLDRLPARSPNGLLHADPNIVFSVVPFHVGIRWYWQDPQSLSAWLRSDVHRRWWTRFVDETRGTEIWRETYHPRSGPTAVSRGAGLPGGLDHASGRALRHDAVAPNSRHYEGALTASA